MAYSINIVSFDVPYPANYGGVIDVFYKLWWLKQNNVKIYLHCFSYGRKPSEELEQLCEKVYYYPRKTGLLANLSLLPYNVRSRQSKALEGNLLKNDYPILFEVLHTCYLLDDKRFKDRVTIYRHSNIEHVYYRELATLERNFLKKMYLKIEAWKLRRFEPIVNSARMILAVNEKDTTYFKGRYPKPTTIYLPSFHQNGGVNIRSGHGQYVLFHGNLSISENYESATWAILHVFSKISHPVIIAGLNPPSFLAEAIKPFPNIKLIANPSEDEMKDLLTNAQIHVLYTAQPTGLKLKLLNVLFAGRFVVCNANMVSGTPLKSNGSLFICESSADFIKHIKKLMTLDFSYSLTEERKIQSANFNNQVNVSKLIDFVFNR